MNKLLRNTFLFLSVTLPTLFNVTQVKAEIIEQGMDVSFYAYRTASGWDVQNTEYTIYTDDKEAIAWITDTYNDHKSEVADTVKRYDSADVKIGDVYIMVGTFVVSTCNGDTSSTCVVWELQNFDSAIITDFLPEAVYNVETRNIITVL